MTVILIIAVLFLSFSNGANDNFKGVATLYGSGRTSFNLALGWATITTFLGSLTALFFATKLVANFSGKGLVPVETLSNLGFLAAVAGGAALTVLIATRIGMPVSSTHGIIGALLGAGFTAVGNSFNYSLLAQLFLIPLILSPILAGILSFSIYSLFKSLRSRLNITRETCVCIGEELIPVKNLTQNNQTETSLFANSTKTIRIDENTTCQEVYRGNFIGLEANKLIDSLHFLSAGAVCFTRGLNDTPKIMGLMLIIPAISLKGGMLLIGIVMAIGGILNAKKVAVTMSKKITPMNQGQGFSANLITSCITGTASLFGLPVSTTHVSVGAIVGIGKYSQQADYSMVKKIVLSWFLTLPVGAVLGAILYLALGSFIS